MKLGSPLCHQDVKMTRLGAGGGGMVLCLRKER